MCRYILSIRLKQLGEAEESAVLQWVEHAAPGAELQQTSPGDLSFSIAQEVCLVSSSMQSSSESLYCTIRHLQIG